MSERLPTHHKIDEGLIRFLAGRLTPTAEGTYIELSESDYEEIGTRMAIAAADWKDVRELGKSVVIQLLEYLGERARGGSGT